jgi:hypothetical protein
MRVRTLEQKDIQNLARWNVQLHAEEGSNPMSVEGETRPALGVYEIRF